PGRQAVFKEEKPKKKPVSNVEPVADQNKPKKAARIPKDGSIKPKNLSSKSKYINEDFLKNIKKYSVKPKKKIVQKERNPSPDYFTKVENDLCCDCNGDWSEWHSNDYY
uniref:Uncharacterized protein n=1 Tax=Panagrolaimus sp. ES5 TaxID=591445 RepID=A0AC34G229_9BILA